MNTTKTTNDDGSPVTLLDTIRMMAGAAARTALFTTLRPGSPHHTGALVLLKLEGHCY